MPQSANQGGPGDASKAKLADRRRFQHMASEARSAIRLASILQNSLERAEHSSEAVGPILDSVLKHESRLSQMATHSAKAGKIHKMVRGLPQHERPIFNFFLDESGKPDIFVKPKKGKIHPHALQQTRQPFVLSGIAITNESMEKYIVSANELKLQYGIPTGISFHEPDMRKGFNEFKFDGQEKQRSFNRALRELVASTEFFAFAIAIRKDFYLDELKKRDLTSISEIDPHLPSDIYELAIYLIMERFINFLHSSGSSPKPRITFEAQGGKENAIHQRAVANLQIYGTRYITDSEFRQYLHPGCFFSPKSGSSPLEIADIVARDVFEWAKSKFQESPPYWDILSKKWYKRDDALRCKHGLKVFPDFDIRDLILAHRLNGE